MKISQITFLFIMVCVLCSCKQDVKIDGRTDTKIMSNNYSPAHALIAKMVDKVGTTDKLKALKDVEYTYTYYDKGKDLKDISTERYLFEGEKSWAQYDVHQKFVMPDKVGKVIQAYNGHTVWTSLNDKVIDDPDLNRTADFLRKTNFYWFAMMPKLMDEGVNYKSMEDRSVDGQIYKIVKITYAADIGDVQDEYILYINPETNLVDQFLFTVMDFNITEPLLMKVEYTEIEGLLLTTKRVYTRADWQGNIKGENWTEEITENVKFNNGFDDSLFEL